MDEDFFDDEDPEAIFQIPKESEDLIKGMVYELAVRNFIATFSPECSNAKTEEERLDIKDRILDELYESRPDYEYSSEIPSDIYTIKDANRLFDEMLKRGEEGEYVGPNKILTDIASKITIEIYEKYCLRMVDRGEMSLVFDETQGGFAFKPIPKKEDKPINKIKPRRKKQ